MEILITNDDGYKAKGINALVDIVKQLDNAHLTVLAPKVAQSGMSLAISLRDKDIAYKNLGEIDSVAWHYLNASPASCVKLVLSESFFAKPDLVISGINHGSNAASAASYSGTLGAAEEAAINKIPAIAVSLDNEEKEDIDFSAVKKYLPNILKNLIPALQRGAKTSFYNINFPNLPANQIKGIRIGHQGLGHWEKEFEKSNLDPSQLHLEEGEIAYMMTGEFIDEENTQGADHHLNQNAYISIVSCTIDKTDYQENARLKTLNIEEDFS